MSTRYNTRRIDADVACRNCRKTIPHGCTAAVMLIDRTMYCCECSSEEPACPTCAPPSAEVLAEMEAERAYWDAVWGSVYIED